MTPGRGRGQEWLVQCSKILETGMSLNDIVVFLDPFIDTEARLKVAIELAKAHGARLTGVDISTRAALEGPMHFAAGALEQRFNEVVQSEQVEGVYKIADHRSQSWKDFYSHYADLVIASQHNPETPARLAADIVESVLLSAGVPMLIFPAGWQYTPIGQRVALAWNASREATRAVHDALPLLRTAKKVVLFEFAPRADLIESALELMADHLKRHGVQVDIQSWQDTAGNTPISTLFAALDKNDIDLIVAGAYGHSRLFEEFFGGLTRDFLKQPSMPVLLSH